jgi:hypothetical protein
MTMAAIQHVILHRDGWPQRFPATGAALLASPDGKLQVRFDGVTNEGFDEGVDAVDALLREAEKGLHLADLITAHQQRPSVSPGDLLEMEDRLDVDHYLTHALWAALTGMLPGHQDQDLVQQGVIALADMICGRLGERCRELSTLRGAE